MSEYRQDPLSRQWVIIGCEDRAGRPNEFVEATIRQSEVPCPFCAGNESETPPAIAAYAADGAGPWQVRVVPNKYPAVTPDAQGSAVEAAAWTPDSPRPASRDWAAGAFRCRPAARAAAGFGEHEVIIESPRHVASLSELSDGETELVFAAYRDRIARLKADGRFGYVQIFKNAGPAAGASLEHVHSQLVALPWVPQVVQQELQASEEHWQARRQSLLVEIIQGEVDCGERVVAQTDRLVAFCPYASRFPYEVWIAPRRQQSRFEAVEAGEVGELSRLARDIIARIERAAGRAAYNYFLHTLPFDGMGHDHYHWHFEILPRITKVAGFEWSTGCFINPYPPEAAAAHLRACR